MPGACAMLWMTMLLVVGCARPTQESDLLIVFGGDVMVGRGVARACQQHGPDYPFRHIASRLQQADLAFANLEGPLTDRPTRIPRINALRGAPEMAPVLRRAGFTVLSVANNHSIDYRRVGLAQTREVLSAAGITPVGAGPSLAEAERGSLVTVRGLTVGFLAYNGLPMANFIPAPDRESFLALNEASLRRTIPALRQRCQMLVVSFHWGQEGQREVTPDQRRLAHLAADLGADVIVGHHSHVRSEIERYRQSLLAYSLGNLVFDELSYGGNEGYLLTCRFSRDGSLQGFSTTPTRVVNCQALVGTTR